MSDPNVTAAIMNAQGECSSGSLESRPGILGWLDANFEKPFLVAGMLAIIFIITFQTLYRYIGVYLHEGAAAAVWTEEMARFIFIWISYLAVPVAIKNRSSIRVDIIFDRLPVRFQNISWIIVDVCFLTLAATVLWQSLDLIKMQLTYPQTSPALQLPYYIPYLVLPVSFGLMAVRLLQDLAGQVRICGAADTVIGLILCAVLAAPLFIADYIDPLPVLFGYFALFLVVGVPIAIGLGLAALATIVAAGSLPIDYVAQIAFTSIDSFPIMAIPFFIAAGVFMGAGGLSRRLLNLADEMLGALPGGMALATIGTCMFFAAISGSGPATVAAIGSLTIPAMVERGYCKYFSAAIVAAAGAIGVMIPPSNPFVVYGVSAQASIGKLFMGGIVPGLLTGLALMAYSYWYSKKRGWKGEVRDRNLKTFMHAVWEAKWALMVPVIVLGGIYGGIMTPTEAAALAAFYGLIIGCFVHRELSCGSFYDCVVEAAGTSAMVIVLMSMATIFGNIMTIEEVPATIAQAMLGLTTDKIAILLMINVLLLIIGTFMEALAAIVILTPILLPIVLKVGVDPVHFGIIMVVNLAIGFVTPPVGVNLFVASGVANAKIEQLSKVVLPLIALMLAVLLITTYVPAIPMFFAG
jgi:C4-dicarboxylate transporter DctM subunit